MINCYKKEEIKDVNIYYNDIIEVNGCFTPYDKSIDYKDYIRKICENLKEIELLNNSKNKLFHKTELLRDLLQLTEQHKNIYETHSIIHKEFKEQAGSYKDVIKSCNYYKEKYSKEYLESKANIEKEITKYSEQIVLWLKESCLKIELIFTISNKTTYRIYN